MGIRESFFFPAVNCFFSIPSFPAAPCSFCSVIALQGRWLMPRPVSFCLPPLFCWLRVGARDGSGAGPKGFNLILEGSDSQCPWGSPSRSLQGPEDLWVRECAGEHYFITTGGGAGSAQAPELAPRRWRAPKGGQNGGARRPAPGARLFHAFLTFLSLSSVGLSLTHFYLASDILTKSVELLPLSHTLISAQACPALTRTLLYLCDRLLCHASSK